MGNLNDTSELRKRIRQIQLINEGLQRMSTQSGVTVAKDGVLLFNQRMCVLNYVELRIRVLEEANKSVFTIHRGS